MAERLIGGRWRVIRKLAKGGQGTVFEVEDVSAAIDDSSLGEKLKAVFRDLSAAAYRMENLTQDREVFESVVRHIMARAQLPKAALKELLPLGSAVNAQSASARMQRELAVLEKVRHPALIRVLDSNLGQRWFVTEFFPEGDLATGLERFKGDVPAALKAFRPIVEAVSLLHEAGIVHRDVKPDNVFIGPDSRLVLGDCGLAIRLEDQDRLTDTYENVGSRDWMPGWAMGMRLEDVKPNFDVFSLGKLLWALVAGRQRLRLWYHRKPESNLATLLPGNEAVEFIQAILDQTVVEEAESCLPDAGALLVRVDQAIDAVEKNVRIVGGDFVRRCLVCGDGTYRKIVDHESTQQRNFGLEVVGQPKFRIFFCDNCGHTQTFYSADGVRPRAWKS